MKTILALLCTLMALGAQADTEVAGIKFSSMATVDGQSLILNGAGLRKKLFFKVYAAGLYLPAKSSDAVQVMDADTPRRIDLTMLRDVSAEKFVTSLKDGLKANRTEAELANLKPRIDAFSAMLMRLKEAREGQRFQMDYAPGSGTRLVVDGAPAGKAIEGADFYRALLSVWIGKKPAQDDLKAALMGR